MSLGGQDEPSAHVIVYGPDGTMYGSPAQARAAGVYDSKMQQQMPAVPYDGSGQFMPIAQPSIGDFEQRQFLPSRQLEPEINQNGMPMPTAPFSSGGGAKVGGLNGALQPRSMAVDQPFSQPLRSFGGFNNLPSAGAMNQFPTPAAAPMFQYGQGSMMDPTLMAQQAILARPMRPSFTGQQLMSREVPLGIQGNNGLAYPSMGNSGLLNAPSYTSRYASGGGGGGGGDVGQAPSGWSSMTPAEQASYYAENPNMAAVTRAGQAAFGYTLPGLVQGLVDPGLVRDQGLIALGISPDVAAAQEVGRQNAQEGFRAAEYGLVNQYSPDAIAANVAQNAQSMQSMQDALAADQAAAQQGSSSGFDGNFGSEAGPASGLSNEAGSTDATAAADNSGNTSSDSGGGGKIVCTAMNQQYGFGSFRNAIWLKYAENNLTKAHEAGYHAIFLPLVDFAFKQGDGKLNMLTRKFLENCARHRSLDLRAEMRGTKRDTIGMIYRSVLEPLCYAVGKFKGY